MPFRTSPRPLPARFERLKAESFIRGTSMLAVIIDERAGTIGQRLEALAAEEGWQVLGRHDIAARLADAAGAAAPVRAARNVLVFELDRPELLAPLVAADATMALALPLRVVLHDAHGVTTVTTPRPSVLWPEQSHAPEVARLGRELELGLQHLLRSLP